MRTKLSKFILPALFVFTASACTSKTELMLRSEIKDCGKLVLAEMSIRKVGKIKDKPVSESTGLKSLFSKSFPAYRRQFFLIPRT